MSTTISTSPQAVFVQAFKLFSEVFLNVPLGLSVLEEHETNTEDTWPNMSAWIVQGRPPALLTRVSLENTHVDGPAGKGQMQTIGHLRRLDTDTGKYTPVPGTNPLGERIHGFGDLLGWLSEALSKVGAPSRWYGLEAAGKTLLPHVWDGRVHMPSTCKVAEQLMDLFGTSMWAASYPFSYVHPSYVEVRQQPGHPMKGAEAFSIQFLRVGDPKGIAFVTPSTHTQPNSLLLSQILANIENVAEQLRITPWVIKGAGSASIGAVRS